MEIATGEEPDAGRFETRLDAIAGRLGAPSRRVHIVTNHAAIRRARRKRAAWGEDDHAIYTRHRWQVEGAHGTAKTLDGLAGAVGRGLENMKSRL